MNLRRKKREALEGTGATSDIAFLLIIYFIVIAGFNVNRGFLMNLPAKNSAKLILRDDLLRFELDGAGNVFFQGEKTGLAGAEKIISSAAASRPNTAVALSVSGRAPWQAVVSFVELAQKLRIDSFSFKLSEGGGDES